MTLPDPQIEAPAELDTALCSTCGEPSSFVDNRPGANAVGYCAKDLPGTLQEMAANGQLEVNNDEALQQLAPPTPEQELADDAEAAQDKVDRAARRR